MALVRVASVNQDRTTPLLVDQPTDYDPDSGKPAIKHHWAKWVVLTLVVFAVLGVFIYALVYTFMNTYDQPVPSPFVVLSTGNISGYWDTTIVPNLAVFKGIPYAEPPVGSLRWQPAQPIPMGNNWGYMETTTDGASCYQFGAYPQSSFPNQDEDCLYLNVWTSNINNQTGLWQNQTALLPTLVWIYGGGNVNGWADSYTGLDNWAKMGQVCLVAMNYRVNAFGYMALSSLSANDTRGVSGNYGITDIQLALQWIQDEIVNFGCNKDQVTIFGQSSGGTNVLALLTNSANNGLFNAAISLSGSTNITMNLAQAEAQNSATFLQNTPCKQYSNQQQLACLLALSPNQILNAIPNSSYPNGGWAVTNFFPTSPMGLGDFGLVIVDGVTVPMSLLQTVQQKTPPVDVPLILQNVRDELELFYDAPNVVTLNASAYNAFLVQNFAPWPYSNQTGETVAELYQNVTDMSVERSYYDLNTDLGIYCANVQLGIFAAQNFNSPVYVASVWTPPSHAMIVSPYLPPMSDPIHLWDWIAATEAYNFWASPGGTVWNPNTTNGAPGVPSFNPQTQDFDLGTLLANEYYSLIMTGKISNPTYMQPINNASGFPMNWNVAVHQLGGPNNASVVANTVNFRMNYCNTLAELGLGYGAVINDTRFWWVN